METAPRPTARTATPPAPPHLIAAARAYESLHVPALFEAWTAPVLDAAGVSPDQRVLDVACGTGVLARTALARVGPSGSVTGLDPHAGMLTVAAEVAPAVTWREGSATSIPFSDASFGAVVSQFGMMFFPDPVAAVVEMLRVLEPGGRLAVAVWDAVEEQPAYAVLVELLERKAGKAAADALRAPFALGDLTELRRVFHSAGLSTVEVATHTRRARFPSVRVMVEAELHGWLPVMGVQLDDSTAAEVLEESEQLLAPYVNESGSVEFTTSAHIVSGASL